MKKFNNNLRRYGGAPGSGGISFQLELEWLNILSLRLYCYIY